MSHEVRGGAEEGVSGLGVDVSTLPYLVTRLSRPALMQHTIAGLVCVGGVDCCNRLLMLFVL